MANPAYTIRKSTETGEMGVLGALLKDTPNLKKLWGGRYAGGGGGGGGSAITIAGGYPYEFAEGELGGILGNLARGA